MHKKASPYGLKQTNLSVADKYYAINSVINLDITFLSAL